MHYAIYMNPTSDSAESVRSPLQRNLAWTAAACWLAAWFLPAIDGFQGWEAFRAAIETPFNEHFNGASGEDTILITLSALTNVAFAVQFALWRGRRISRPSLFVKGALSCLVINCYWWVQGVRSGDVRDLLVGYYVWLAAFALLLVVAILNAASVRRTSRTPTAGTPA